MSLSLSVRLPWFFCVFLACRLLRSCCNIYFAIIDSAIQSPPGAFISACLRHTIHCPIHHPTHAHTAWWSGLFASPTDDCALLSGSAPSVRFTFCRTPRLVLHYTLTMRYFCFVFCFIVQYHCIVVALSIVVCCGRSRRHNHTTIVFARCVYRLNFCSH